jgi:hypothetical protein
MAVSGSADLCLRSWFVVSGGCEASLHFRSVDSACEVLAALPSLCTLAGVNVLLGIHGCGVVVRWRLECGGASKVAAGTIAGRRSSCLLRPVTVEGRVSQALRRRRR